MIWIVLVMRINSAGQSFVDRAVGPFRIEMDAQTWVADRRPDLEIHYKVMVVKNPLLDKLVSR